MSTLPNLEFHMGGCANEKLPGKDDGVGLQADPVGLGRPLDLDLHDDHIADPGGPGLTHKIRVIRDSAF